MELQTSTCVNCAQPVSTSYCSNCGQKNPPKKLKFLTMWLDFQAHVYGFDGMFFRTLKDLTVRPGKVARAFIQGNRVKYYWPIGYFFLTITVYLLLASILGVDLYEFTEASNSASRGNQSAGQKELEHAINVWINDNMRLMTFILALGNVLFTWMFFRKSGYNFIESSALIFLINGHAIWLTILSLIAYRFSGYAFNAFLLLLLTTLYTIFAFVNFYTHLSKAKAIVKGMLVVVCSYLLLLIIFIAGFVIYFLAHPELLEKFKTNK